MASTDKTPKLGLNQWAAGDDVLRADFNADNGKIDAGVAENARAAAAAALAASNAVMKFKSAVFMGDGTDMLNIDLGFAPKVLMISCPMSPVVLTILTTEVAFDWSRTSASAYEASISSIKLTGTGFCIKNKTLNPVNCGGYYIAIG